MRHLPAILLCLACLHCQCAAQAAPPDELIAAAKAQIGVTLRYDARYQRIAYPLGDVPVDRGVCTDVVVRAYRRLGIDLQERVHQDMRSAWNAYPHKNWGLKRPDPNIDHRRVPNLATFFRRHGTTLPVTRKGQDYRPGDIVTWMLPGNLPHIGMVGDGRSANGDPLVVHNIGSGTQMEDALFAYPITGHYRYFPSAGAGR